MRVRPPAVAGPEEMGISSFVGKERPKRMAGGGLGPQVAAHRAHKDRLYASALPAGLLLCCNLQKREAGLSVDCEVSMTGFHAKWH